MIFQSILFDQISLPKIRAEQPASFLDLNLDQVIDVVAKRKEDYKLKSFYWTSLRDIDLIHYRHAIFQDLEDKALMGHINSFAKKMIIVRRYLGMVEKLEHQHHREGWFLEAVLLYCQAVTQLASDLREAQMKSRGFLTFREYLTNYAQSQTFLSLQAEAQKVKDQLANIKYSVIVEIGKFSVRKYEEESDYSVEVEKTFEKFKQGAVKNYLLELNWSGMNHIEAIILDFVAQLYPTEFAALTHFCQTQSKFMNETLSRFDREVQFYVAYLEFITDIKYKGLTFCYPEVGTSREVYAYDGFDLALANALRFTESPVICNDFELHEPEHIIVVTGPNQGGKTTFARMFGQLHYLASLGCPVPGREARLFLFDQIFAHFERQEDITNLRGKLEDDVARVHEILAKATSDSILILNEIFASTTVQDAVFLSKKIMTRAMELDALCIWVTFMDELASLSEKTVSMVSTVVPENPALRTFKIIRKPADGLAYALSLAEKHHLTYQQIKERIKS